MKRFISITKALSDENRIRILWALRGRELCVCQLIELLGLAPSTVSKHLSILKNALLIESRKQGRWMYYRLAEKEGAVETRDALDWVFRSIAETRQTQEDSCRLGEILKIDTEILCSQRPRIRV